VAGVAGVAGVACGDELRPILYTTGVILQEATPDRREFAYVVVGIADAEFEGELLVHMCRKRAVASEPSVANAVTKVWTRQKSAKQVSVSRRRLAVVLLNVL
jgi:hypothetical protein